ncbi:hypothetical protein NEOLEDRAFT_1182643 [Neolentinus lepideus HHB14362 ss-1]|uniref:Uncharacterized protein n=1 Tax=Neolentinus lepideus HHB14362 ss-1 TaxID=1314782 RepID=A0A165NZT6_9AGAM|nr:hypothetical protein NEOLEDRAFT_1182643 [Neolentinus lepideus HHB14362 ss-1]
MTVRQAGHEPNSGAGQGNFDDRLVLLFCQSLKAQQDVGKVTSALIAVKDKLEVVEEKVNQTWRPTEAQEKLLRNLIKHFFVQPQYSYLTVTGLVEDYIQAYAITIRLGLYQKDATMRNVVTTFIHKAYHDIKSNLRKAVFTSITKRTPLDKFVKKIIQDYHLPQLPSNSPQNILAAMALLRDIAFPLAGKENTRGADTGFWREVEKKLEDLTKEMGLESRSTDAWLDWEVSIIDADNTHFTRHLVATAPALQPQAIAVSGMVGAQLLPLGGESSDASDVMNGEVDISTMNLAATAGA